MELLALFLVVGTYAGTTGTMDQVPQDKAVTVFSLVEGHFLTVGNEVTASWVGVKEQLGVLVTTVLRRQKARWNKEICTDQDQLQCSKPFSWFLGSFQTWGLTWPSRGHGQLQVPRTVRLRGHGRALRGGDDVRVAVAHAHERHQVAMHGVEGHGGARGGSHGRQVVLLHFGHLGRVRPLLGLKFWPKRFGW